MSKSKGRYRALAATVAIVATLVPGGAAAATDTATELFISEYIEGTSNNKAVEIYNGTAAAVDLGAGGYNLQMYFNGNPSAGLTINLTGTVTAGDVFVLAHSSAVAAILAVADQTNGAGWFNGDDAVVLRKGTDVIDAIGQVGFDPGTEWGTGLVSTADNTLRRKASVCSGDTDPSDVFDPAVEWDGFATDTFDGLGSHTATCEAGEQPPPPPPPACFDAPEITFISAIQGDGETSPCAGQTVTIEGVVVGDYEGPSPNLRGFYVQEEDEDWDDDPATSEGIFVFNFNNESVSLGDVVRVTGPVAEFQGQTQLGSVVDLQIVGAGASVTPTEVLLPVPSADHLERYEGMLVTMPQTLYVTEFFQLGRFGQVVVSSGDRLRQPTDFAAPGAAANAAQAANNLNRLIVDDGINNQNPDPIVFGRNGDPLSADNTLRGGDTLTGAVGVMTYTWAGNAASGNAFRLRPQTADGTFVFEEGNPRPHNPPAVGGTATVASFNVLNYFVTFGAVCGPTGFEQPCRGAENDTEFERQRVKLLAALEKIDADVVGLVELENTTGVEPLADIVAGLNENAGEELYDYIPTGTVGTDVIKVGLIYKPGSVTPVGEAAYLDSTVDDRFDDDLNRVPVAQSFVENATGEIFSVVVNHLKSKGCTDATGADLDQGDGQGCFNAARTAAAEALVDWMDFAPTGIADPDFLVIGDLNAYAMEDPINVFVDAGYVDMLRAYVGEDAYTYVFDGQWGYLDYALASPSLVAQVTGASGYVINADEPSVLDYNTNFKSAGQIVSLFAPDEFRTSDHDPVLVGLGLATFLATTVATPGELWPPNHRYHEVVVTSSSGATALDVLITGVVSSEADSGLGDDDLPNDIVVTGDDTVDLRAERYSTEGRVYSITVVVSAADGQTKVDGVSVLVPLDQRREPRPR
jgi:uncharacterized protein